MRVPAIQLELPITMRKELMRNDELFKHFAGAVMHSYKYMVSSFKSWDSKPPICGCKKHLSEPKAHEIRRQAMQPNGEPYSKTLEECELMLRELNHVDRTNLEKQI
mmetsp:Transcript_56641/g.91705  ORF Transcript_56641/g.91705 Transcript_56641/m.91705 type:complete len:106 (+) Transcript_56641:265-582(+)